MRFIKLPFLLLKLSHLVAKWEEGIIHSWEGDKTVRKAVSTQLLAFSVWDGSVGGVLLQTIFGDFGFLLFASEGLWIDNLY